MHWDNIGHKAIRRAFKLEGYIRGIRRRKPLLSEANVKARLAWAYEHENWTDKQWDTIAWSDESWVCLGPHKRQWCTRLIGPSELFGLTDCV